MLMGAWLWWRVLGGLEKLPETPAIENVIDVAPGRREGGEEILDFGLEEGCALGLRWFMAERKRNAEGRRPLRGALRLIWM